MVQPISDERVFYVTKTDPEGREMYEAINPLAYGLKVASSGMASWYDMAADYMRAIEAKKSQNSGDSSYEIADDEGCLYRFELVDKRIYDTIVHGLLPGSPPTFETDADVQNWLIKPHGDA